MKSALALLVPLLGLANASPLGLEHASPLETRQDHASMNHGGHSEAAPAPGAKSGGLLGGTSAPPSVRKIKEIKQIKTETGVKGAKRVQILYGPYKLKAANSTVKLGNGQSMDLGGTSYQDLVGSDFPTDITVLETFSSVVNPKTLERATTAEGIYNHHNVFMHISAPKEAYGCGMANMTATKSPLPYTVFTAGATEVGTMVYYSKDKSIKTGYYLEKGMKMMNMIDVVNYNNEEKEVYTLTQIEYLPGKQPGWLRATQQRIDPSICGGANGAAIHPPVGQKKFQVKSEGIVALADGWAVNIRGHMHDGGEDIAFMVNGKEVCRSKAIYGGEGHETTVDGKVWKTIAESSACEDPIAIKKGDKLDMVASYDVEAHPSREQGGHGGMMGGMMKSKLRKRDGDAEQMALVITMFAFKE